MWDGLSPSGVSLPVRSTVYKLRRFEDGELPEEHSLTVTVLASRTGTGRVRFIPRYTIVCVLKYISSCIAFYLARSQKNHRSGWRVYFGPLHAAVLTRPIDCCMHQPILARVCRLPDAEPAHQHSKHTAGATVCIPVIMYVVRHADIKALKGVCVIVRLQYVVCI